MATVTTVDLTQKLEEIERRRRSGEIPGAITLNAGVRVSIDGEGCGIPGCNCSPGYWISISNGKTLLRVDLSEEEAEDIKKGYLDTL